MTTFVFPQPPLADWDLLRKHIAGDPKALGELMKRHERGLTRVLGRLFAFMSSDERYATIQDVLQETWIRIDRHAANGRATSKFTTWLYTIAVNLAHNVHRDRKRRQGRHVRLPAMEINSDEVEVAEFQLADSSIASRPDLAYEAKEAQEIAARKLESIFGELTEDQRAVLSARGAGRKEGGQGYSALAEVLGLNLGTVKSRLHRARVAARAAARDTHGRRIA